MGLDFIRDKNTAFEQRRDASRNQEFDLDLLTASALDEVRHVFQCRLTDLTTQLTPGLGLVIRAFSETEMRVSQGGKVIGFVVHEDARRLAQLMKKNQTHTGILTVTPSELPDISGDFSVRPLKPFKQT